jgi:hypothetical protein
MDHVLAVDHGFNLTPLAGRTLLVRNWQFGLDTPD